MFIMVFVSSCRQAKNTENERNNRPYEGPIRLLPENPHYFEYKGEPLVIISSAEHYGALLNLDFDYKKYLNTLASDGMNYTRIFSGTYAEIPSASFGIKNNTLAPRPDRFLTPWSFKMVNVEGKYKRIYDLTRWNADYFCRLIDILRQADEQDIIVEMTLFTSIYSEDHWAIDPENPANNNIDQPLDYHDAHTMGNGELLKYQEMFVRKMARELNDFNNFFFEIQNEPWADNNVPVYNIVNQEALRENDWTYKVDMATGTALEWEATIAGYITDEESQLEKKHLLAQNYCNYKAPLSGVQDNISILNFHYAWPEAVEWNYGFDRVIGFDESGFAGSGDQVYRRQAWRFILSGGGLFNNLDYSFFTGYEKGTLENSAPGGGSPALRKQLKILSDFIHGFNLPAMEPDCKAVIQAPGIIPYVLSDRGRSYALFLQAVGVDTGFIDLSVPEGKYHVKWIDTLTGETLHEEDVRSVRNNLELKVTFVDGEIAAKITVN